jgi:thiol:disulfide interchange protein DsbD
MRAARWISRGFGPVRSRRSLARAAALLAAVCALWALGALRAEPAWAASATGPRLEWALFALAAPSESVASSSSPLLPPGPGAEPAVLAVAVLRLPAGAYVYGPDPQFTGQPTRLAVEAVLGSGATSPGGGTDGAGGAPLAVAFPPTETKIDAASGRKVRVFHDGAPFFLVLPAFTATPAAPATVFLRGALRALLCTDTTCTLLRLPVAERLDGVVPAALEHAEVQPWWPLYQLAAPASAASVPSGPEPAAPGAPAADDASISDDASGASVSLAPAGGASVSASGGWSFEPRYFSAALEVGGLGKAILFGLLAGFILNFMPCVLPVVGLKVSTLLAATGEAGERERVARFREHNIFFSAGVLLYFLVLAMLFGTLGVAWGSLFQRPGVVLALAVAVFVLGLSLFGVMDLPVVDLKGGGGGGGGGGGRVQALFTGLLATVLATPCSGPLLGGVLGWTLWQPARVTVAVFLAIGLGMALPYLAMAARPGLARFYPRPGRWVGYVERGVAFFLMATCAYLVSILPPAMTGPALAVLLGAGFAAWMWGGWTGLTRSRLHRFSVRLAAVVLAVGVAAVALAPRSEAGWEPFEPASFAASLGRDRLLVDFTADWCPNCRLLEQAVLTPERLARWRAKWGVRLVQVDMTAEDAETAALLKALGSASIPVVALFPAGEGAGRPVVLRDLFTGAQIEAALEQAFGSGSR